MGGMEKVADSSLFDFLSSLEDPRSGENVQHNITEILFIAVCAVLSGCESWYQVEDYAETKEEWLKSFLELKNGPPSHDTFRRVFCILDFERFQKVFFQWTQEIRKHLNIKAQDQICIDGKTLRGSINKSKSMKALHMVNAWSKNISLNLGQVCVENKSNEITAIPKLLDMLDIKGCLVSIDAMGCQKDIVEKIIDKGADFLLSLKGNQSGLFEATQEVFRRASTRKEQPMSKSTYTEKEESHGRKVKRKCTVLTLDKDKKIDFFPHVDWPSIVSLIQIKNERLKISTNELSKETRFYISSSQSSAKYFSEGVKTHWEVENKLHWSLDVSMGEDQDKKWADESGKNFGLLRQFALSLLKKYSDKKKRGIKRKK